MTGGAAHILGVRVDCLDQAGLLAACEARLDGGGQAWFGYTNAHSHNTAYEHAAFRATLNAFDIVYADGVGAVLASLLRRGCRLRKLTGADWLDALCARLARRGARIYLLAGQRGVAARAGAALAARFPGLVVAGTADGFFAEKSEAQVRAEIAACAPDVLFVGMGTPRQEMWIAAHCRALPVKICWAVGALFDYVAGVEARAPRWLLALGLEWLYRLREDPAGKWRRYLLGNPLFLWRVLRHRR
jgi:N-acetylglucosaminyldiphosphoundecaprenol N-acetyl-beta-D-mannosaminyltransferase